MSPPSLTGLLSSEPARLLDASGLPLGSTEPRLWTPPLRELTPETSYGFDVIDFARGDLGHPLDPWQEFAVIHGGELLPDGRPRFRIVIVLVARQNGKTEVLVVLTLFWQFVECWPLILGTSTKLEYAKESWRKAVKLAERTSALDALHLPGRRWKRETNGEQESWTVDDSRYKIAASNAEGGRSLTINRAILDELRQHHTYDAWNAVEPAASPPDAQIWALSNAGEESSVVLNEQRAAALDFIKTGKGDPRVGLFEWSAPEGSEVDDVNALAQANPNVGRRTPAWDALLGAAARAKEAGGDQLAGFKTERMCITVPRLELALDVAAWDRGHVPGSLSGARGVRQAWCLDLSPDLTRAAILAGGVLPDGRVRLGVVADFADERQSDGSLDSAVEQMRRALPALVEQGKPAVIGWLPGGPAAAVAADMVPKPRAGWPPRGTKIEEIRGEVPAICLGLAQLIRGGRVVHAGDPLLSGQVAAAGKLGRGDVWVFSRRGGYVHAVYAAAGAAHLARTLPPPMALQKMISAS